MNIIPTFSSPVGFEYLSVDNNLIKDFCYDEWQKSNAKFKDKGWQSGFLDLESPQIVELVTEVRKCVDEMSSVFKIKDQFKLKLTNAWININPPNSNIMQHNIMHLHSGKFISFVYYVKCEPGCGNLQLMSPLLPIVNYAIPEQVFSESNMLNGIKWIITPEPSKLVAFPAWVQHYAEINNSNDDRISIAFNAELQNTELLLRG
jgi:uncharacterized protein (TIGR02466 family)